MKKLAIIFFIFLACVASGFSQPLKVKVYLHDTLDYGVYRPFAVKSVNALEHALNSPEFRDKVFKMLIVHANGTHQQLYDKIMKAHETVGPGGTDYVVDLRVRILQLQGKDHKWKKWCNRNRRTYTIGVDNGEDGYCATCPQSIDYWYKTNDVGALAGHYAHEYMHELGFDHYKPFSTQSWREITFVYQIGEIVEYLVSKNKW